MMQAWADHIDVLRTKGAAEPGVGAQRRRLLFRTGTTASAEVRSMTADGSGVCDHAARCIRRCGQSGRLLHA
jgi:hypothetical protein